MDQWTFISFKLPVALEAAAQFSMSKEEILILGGRNQIGNTAVVYSFSMVEEEVGVEARGKLEEVGDIGLAR